MALSDLKVFRILACTAMLLGAAEVAGATDRSTLTLSLDALMTAAQGAESAGRDDQAAALYRQAHEAFPFASEPLAAWGQLANRIGAHEEAVVLLEAALVDQNHDRGVRRNLGEALINLDRAGEALAIYEKLLAEDPTQPTDWNGKALALELVDRRMEASEAYRAGLAVAPGDPQLTRNLDLPLASSAPQPANGIALAYNADAGIVAIAASDSVVPKSASRDP